MKPLVIYHGSCYDGFTAAWIAREADALAGVAHDYHAAKYGEEPPDVRGRSVYILDFSYPRDAMERIVSEAAQLVVLDHHKTAEEALRDLVGTWDGGRVLIRFDMEKSGAGLAWDYFIGGGERHPLVDMIEDRDLWRFRFGEDTRNAHARIAALPMTFDAWSQAMNECVRDRSGFLRQGESVRQYIDRYCEKAAEEARLVEWSGVPVVLVNVPYQNASEMAGVLLDAHPEARFTASWFQRADGHVQFSLRSRGDFDVAEVAKTFGGGGHKAAAGFDVPSLNDAAGLIDATKCDAN